MHVLKDAAAGLLQGEEEELLQGEEEDARLQGNESIDCARARAGRGLLKPLPPRITQVSICQGQFFFVRPNKFLIVSFFFPLA